MRGDQRPRSIRLKAKRPKFADDGPKTNFMIRSRPRPGVNSKKSGGLLGKFRKRQRNREISRELRLAPRNQKNHEVRNHRRTKPRS